MSRIVTLTAVILTLMIVPTSIYALQNTNNQISVKTPEEIALEFIKGHPTFAFDGIASTLKVEGVTLNKSNPPQYVVTVSYQCLHGGFGDRAGMIVTQAITPHTAVLTILSGSVMSAVLDGEWDEITQKTVVESGKSSAEEIALSWIINAPTFKFDGVEGSARVVESWLAQTFVAPAFYGVVIEFDCMHPGYGDRSGEVLAQVITHHVVTVHVTDGQVTMAPIDDAWDEIHQVSLVQQQEILTPEEARDIAIRAFLAAYDFNVELPTEWTVKNLNTGGLVGHQTTQYTSGDWNVTVDYAVVWKPTYTVTIVKGDATWKGEVDQSGSVSITSDPEKMPRLIYTPDIVRKLCLDYLLTAHPEMVKGEIPLEWKEKNLVPDGIVGATNIEFTSGSWTVTVSGPVVWMPTYEVVVTHVGEDTSYVWKGTVPQSGPIQEISFG